MTENAIDRYIVTRKEFARPILEWFRAVVQTSVPVEETFKWSFPHFMYKGKILCSMAAFTNHCAFGIPVLTQVESDIKIDRSAMGHFGRVSSQKDLPSATALKSLLKKAAKLIDEGVNPMAREHSKPQPLALPSDFSKVLSKNKAAKKVFDALTPGHRNEYIRWII